MNENIKELLETVKEIFLEYKLEEYPIGVFRAVLTEKYGFDFSRKVAPRLNYLFDRKILFYLDKKKTHVKLVLPLLADLLQEPELNTAIKEFKAKQETNEKEGDNVA